MGYNLHITRAKEHFDSADNPITKDEWLAYVDADPTLKRRPENGDLFCEWKGLCSYGDGSWFDWLDGAIFTKNPDPAIIRKMLFPSFRWLEPTS